MAEFNDAQAEVLFGEFDKKPGNGHDSDQLGEWDAGADPGRIPPREWLLSNQFCRGFISSLVAAGGVGKSALRLLQFVSLALGRPLCGQHIFHRSRVLLISLEDDTWELQRRIKAIADHFHFRREELSGWLFCATPRMAKIAELKDRKRSIGPLSQQIHDAIIRRKPDLISLDPYVKLHGLSENDSGDMDFVCNLLAAMAIEFNLAVDTPHHVHKGIVIPGDADSGRGSSGIRDAGRLVYTLTPMSEEEALTFNVSLEDRASYIRLDPAKLNIAARVSKATWFHIIGTPIQNGTAEYPNGDMVQVVEPWRPPELWADVSHAEINQILTIIDGGIAGGNFYTPHHEDSDRSAWRVVQRIVAGKSDTQARQIINSWVKSGVLVRFDYTHPATRKLVKGLKVENSKRPGTCDGELF